MPGSRDKTLNLTPKCLWATLIHIGGTGSKVLVGRRPDPIGAGCSRFPFLRRGAVLLIIVSEADVVIVCLGPGLAFSPQSVKCLSSVPSMVSVDMSEDGV